MKSAERTKVALKTTFSKPLLEKEVPVPPHALPKPVPLA